MTAPRTEPSRRSPGPVEGDGEDGRPGGSRRRLIGWWVAAAVVLAMLGMWGYIFVYHASGAWRSETPGRMDDPAFATAAEPLCQAAVRRTEALPEAWESETAAERAEVVATANAELRALVAGLGRIEVSGEGDRAMAEQWIGDWDRYVADREDYVERLRTDPTARFYVTQSDRDDVQITEAIDRFAAVNQMPSCITPDDLS